MIKEKDVYSYSNEKDILATRRMNDPQQIITIDLVREALNNEFYENVIPATMSDDMLSFKTGFMKKGTAPCLVIAHANAPKDFRKMVVTVVQDGVHTFIQLGWYGESKGDKTNNKLEKGLDKQERYSIDSDIDYLTDSPYFYRSTAKSIAHGIRNKHLAKKANSLAAVEAEYHSMIRHAVAIVADDMKMRTKIGA